MAYAQQGFPQQGFPQQPQAQGAANDPWNPTSGGGGCSEFVFIVKECKPDSNRQDPTKQNITWSGVDHEGKQRIKSWGIGKDWSFNWSAMPPKYEDPKNPGRGVNENTTMGILLRCIRDGVPYDLRAAGEHLRARPGGPLSPAAWTGSRWHFCKVAIDFGQGGPREVLWPIAFLGFEGSPLPAVNWRTADHSSGGFQAQVPAPNGQQQFQQQPAQQFQQQPQQPQQFQQQPQQFQQQPAAQQYPPQNMMQQPPAQNMMQQPQYQQPQPQSGPYAHMPPGGYGTGVHPGFQGGGPAAGPGFPGQ